MIGDKRTYAQSLNKEKNTKLQAIDQCRLYEMLPVNLSSIWRETKIQASFK